VLGSISAGTFSITEKWTGERRVDNLCELDHEFGPVVLRRPVVVRSREALAWRSSNYADWSESAPEKAIHRLQVQGADVVNMTYLAFRAIAIVGRDAVWSSIKR
jgi:hypothetical protein